MLNSKETIMRRSSAPLKDEPPRFQLQESDTSQLQSSWSGALAANRVTEVCIRFSASISVDKITRGVELEADIE